MRALSYSARKLLVPSMEPGVTTRSLGRGPASLRWTEVKPQLLRGTYRRSEDGLTEEDRPQDGRRRAALLIPYRRLSHSGAGAAAGSGAD